MGRFQQADGGTLFLDEIGDINLEVQTKLLRVLQEMSFERVGSSQPISVDVRIVAATHQDLEALIESGTVPRRLVLSIERHQHLHAPSLRENVAKTSSSWLSISWDSTARRVGKAVSHLDDSAIEALTAYDWPGNIRELENVIERAVVLCDGPSLTLDDLPPEVRRPSRPRKRLPVAASAPAAARSRRVVEDWQADEPPMDEEAEAYERRRLEDALSEARGIKSEAARLMGLPRSTFFSKLKKHGMA